MSKSHFNTSNVTIQLIERHWKATGGVISIHLMLLFNQDGFTALLPCYPYFNTSNVTIQRCPRLLNRIPPLNFNTSNVTIQPVAMARTAVRIAISIHLMLLFNLYLLHFIPALYAYFNTSNVTIQPTILSHLFYSQFHYTHYISTFS